MTSPDVDLGSILRKLAKEVEDRVIAKTRVPRVLTGTVEDVSEELDTVFVRMDAEAMSADPTVSMNGPEAPGIIPATRLGSTINDEQVRVDFDGPNGASAMQTSVEKVIILPFGPIENQRVRLDGNEGAGYLAFFDDNGDLVGYQDHTQWFMGHQGSTIARLDPFGGLRFRDELDRLRVQLAAPEGLIVRHPESGLSGLTANWDGLVVLDPETGDRISISSGTTSAIPTPKWAGSAAEGAIGTSHSTPAVTTFSSGSSHMDLRFVCASAAGDLGPSGSYTSPAGWTERADAYVGGGLVTLATTCATKSPADAAPNSNNFVHTLSTWTRRHGHSVLIHGPAPTFRSVTQGSVLTTTAQSFTLTVDAPPGIVEGDVLIAHVSIASAAIPVGWTIPEGWRQLGVKSSGVGTTHVLGSGIWYYRVPASPPASQSFTINMSVAGKVTKVQCNVVAAQGAYVYPTGLDIRRNNRSMPRGLEQESTVTVNSPIWSNADLPQAFNNLGPITLRTGRKYKVEFFCASLVFAANSAACHWRLAIQIDTGAGFSDIQVCTRRKLSAAGTAEDFVYGLKNYVPAGDETASFRMNLTNLNAGTGYTVQFQASSQAPRSLTVTDVGAEF